MRERELRCGDAVIRLRHEDCYTLGSVDNPRRYDREYKLADDSFTSFHGVECERSCGKASSCLVAGSGGTTTIHEHSAVMQESSLVLAVGNSLCRLAIPTLEMLWHRKIDTVTCFGVYWHMKQHCLVVHGELEISRVSLDGQIAWQTSGKDVFSEGFELFDDHAVAEDFNHNRYRIELATGDTKIIK